jgi:serine/threonine protein kinase
MMSAAISRRAAVKRRRQIQVDVQRVVDQEYGNSKRRKLCMPIVNSAGTNTVDSASGLPPTSSTPLSPLPQQQLAVGGIDVKADTPNANFRSIGPYRLVGPLEDNPKVFTAVDTRHDGRLVICRRLDRSKYERMMQLSNRLQSGPDAVSGDEEEDNRRASEQIFPPTSEIIVGDDGYFYYFEPKDFGSLHAYVVERKRLSERECLPFFRQIVRLLVYCHQRRVVLRDLKLRKFVFADPERLTIRLDGLDEVYVCPDRKEEGDDGQDDDKISDRHGCPAYVGPEILDLYQKSYSGRAADMWSLGVLLYVMLYGRYPFYDTTPARLFAKIRHAQIHLTDENGVSFEARLLIRCLLRRDPSERPAASEILAHSWLQSGDRCKTPIRPYAILNTATGVRLALTTDRDVNDQCVPSVDVNGNSKSGKTGNGIVGGRRRVGSSSESTVPN